MSQVLPEELHNSFSSWYRKKFNIKKMPGNNDNWIGQESLYDIERQFINDNSDIINEIIDRGGTDERQLPANDLVTIKGFGAPLSSPELNRMIQLAKRPFIENYEQWKKPVLKEILKHPQKLVIWKENALKKFYNRIVSTAKTNKGLDKNEINNYELLINKDGTFDLSLKGPENKFTKRTNSGFQKRTLFDYNLESSGLFNWLSGKDMRREKITEYEGEILKREIKPLYGFLNEGELTNLNEHLLNKGLTIAFSRGESDKIALVKSLWSASAFCCNQYLNLPNGEAGPY